MVNNIYYICLFYNVDFEISLRQSVSFWQISNQLLCLSHFISWTSLGPSVLQFTEGHSLWYRIQGISFQPLLFSFSPFYFTFLDYISDSNSLDWITHFFCYVPFRINLVKLGGKCAEEIREFWRVQISHLKSKHKFQFRICNNFHFIFKGQLRL